MKKRILFLPNFLIVGAAKAATTSLYYYLKQHPDVFLCSPKEPLFLAFANEQIENNKDIRPVSTLAEYAKLFFKSNGEKAIGEASTLYLYKYKESINNIIKYLPEKEKTKIIISLRNPAERAFSHFMMRQRHGLEKLNFAQAIQEEKKRINEKLYFGYVDMGYYYKQVKAYMDVFPNIKIFLFEEIIKQPLKISQEIFHFLGIDYNFKPKIKKAYNISGQPRNKLLNHLLFGEYKFKSWLEKAIPVKPRKELVRIISAYNFKKVAMPKREKRILIELYSKDIDRLAELINKDLSAWKETD